MKIFPQHYEPLDMLAYPKLTATIDGGSLWELIVWREWWAFLDECRYRTLIELGVIR